MNSFNKGVNVYIKLNSIYRDSLVEITFTSFSNFKVLLENYLDILEVNDGNYKEKYFFSEKIDKKYKLSFIARGLISEKELSINPIEYYGTQLYPFISSKLEFNFKLFNSYINTIIVDISNNYRTIWNKTSVKVNEKEFKMMHSEENERILYYFLNQDKDIQKNLLDCKINAFLRLSGTELSKIIDFPIWYWILVLFFTTLAALSAKLNTLLAIIGGSWIFILRHWTRINLPRFHTLITYIYISSTVAIFIWGIFWKIFNYWALVLVLIYGYIIVNLLSEIKKFKFEGCFSNITEKIILRIMKKYKK